MVNVEVIYITEQKMPYQTTLALDSSATVLQALEQSGVFKHFPETRDLPFGIFSKPASYDTRLQDGDRVEIYRSLKVDPKQRRRIKARG